MGALKAGIEAERNRMSETTTARDISFFFLNLNTSYLRKI
jgi:hypothetical protein